jgi:hypothetical protein
MMLGDVMKMAWLGDVRVWSWDGAPPMRTCD